MAENVMNHPLRRWMVDFMKQADRPISVPELRDAAVATEPDQFGDLTIGTASYHLLHLRKSELVAQAGVMKRPTDATPIALYRLTDDGRAVAR